MWNEFILRNKLGPRAARASFEASTLLSQEKINSLRLWCRAPSKNLILQGVPGSGKTYSMYAMIRELLSSYHLSVLRYFKSKDLDERLILEFEKYKSTANFIKSICEVRILFIDDFGIQRASERAQRDMFEIFDTRLEFENLTVLTTNLSDAEIKKVYGSRIFSRLKEFIRIQYEKRDFRDEIVKRANSKNQEASRQAHAERDDHRS